MFKVSLRRAGHVRQYSISAHTPSGWEARLEEDRELRRRNVYQDWHRVERVMAMFRREVSELRASGWMVTELSR